MSLSDLASLGSFVSGLAVLVSVVYLATQVRQGHRASRAQIHQNIVGGWCNICDLVATNSTAFTVGLTSSEKEFAAMSDAGKAEFMAVIFAQFKHYENSYLQFQEGFVRKEDWEAWANMAFMYFRTPGARHWWTLRRAAFSPSFVRFIEESHESSLPLV